MIFFRFKIIRFSFYKFLNMSNYENLNQSFNPEVNPIYQKDEDGSQVFTKEIKDFLRTFKEFIDNVNGDGDVEQHQVVGTPRPVNNYADNSVRIDNSVNNQVLNNQDIRQRRVVDEEKQNNSSEDSSEEKKSDEENDKNKKSTGELIFFGGAVLTLAGYITYYLTKRSIKREELMKLIDITNKCESFLNMVCSAKINLIDDNAVKQIRGLIDDSKQITNYYQDYSSFNLKFNLGTVGLASAGLANWWFGMPNTTLNRALFGGLVGDVCYFIHNKVKFNHRHKKISFSESKNLLTSLNFIN